MRTLFALKIVINFGGSEKICNFAKLKYGFGFSGSEMGVTYAPARHVGAEAPGQNQPAWSMHRNQLAWSMHINRLA